MGSGVGLCGGLWLVVGVWVDGELAEEFAGDGVNDADVEVLDEQDDVGSGVGSSDADVVQLAVDAQGVSINAAHLAAARLWEEYLYSDAGQNGWLEGFARPIRLPAMETSKTADPTALAAIPAVTDPGPFSPTQDQVTAAKNVVTQRWAAAVA